VLKEDNISNMSYAKIASFRTNPTQRAASKGTLSKDGKVEGRQTLPTVSRSARKLKNQKKGQQQSKFISSYKAPAEDICIQDSAVHKTSREITSVQKEETISISSSAKIASNRTNPTHHEAFKDSTSKDGKMKGKQAVPIDSHAVNIPVSAATIGETAMLNKQSQVTKRIPKVAGKDKKCFKCGKFGHKAAACGKVGRKS
jgi:ribosomal protein L19E